MELELTYQLDELSSIARRLLQSFSSRTILFKGDMGSGKTTLIKALIEQLSSKDLIHSPSFSLVNEYDTEDGMVYHFDLYRINEPEEIWDIGFEEYLSQDHWLFIEWPELIKAFLPSNFDQIEISTVSETLRSLKLTINKELLTDSNVMSDI